MTSENAVTLFRSQNLVNLLRNLKETNTSNEFDGSSNEIETKVESLRNSKQGQGLCLVHHAATDTALAAAREVALAAWSRDVKPQIVTDLPLAEMKLFDITRNKNLWPTTIIGNKNFGYLIAGAEAKEDRHIVTLSSGVPIVFAIGSAFQANLALLCHESSATILDVIFQVSGYTNSVISHDYCKIHRGDLTPAHVDIYERNEETTHRMQGMVFGNGEGNVRLCFLRFSHLPAVRTLVAQMIGKDIYGVSGYQALPPDKAAAVIECFRQAGCIQYGSPRDLVLWEPALIHLEMRLMLDGSLMQTNDKHTTTERYIVGTHVPVGFSQQELLEIGCIADQGFVFHPYNNANRGNAADTNSVHKKATQWKVPRIVPQIEKDRAAALATLDYTQISPQWSAAKRRCYTGQVSRKQTRDDDNDEAEAHAKKSRLGLHAQ